MNLEQFLQLFNPLPGNHYLQISTSRDEISDALENILIRLSQLAIDCPQIKELDINPLIVLECLFIY